LLRLFKALVRPLLKISLVYEALMVWRHVRLLRSRRRPRLRLTASPGPQGQKAQASPNPSTSPTYLPIIFIHSGDSDYLGYTLGQARYSNPLSRIYLLGDAHNDHYDVAEHHDYKAYFTDATTFAELYEHHTTNPYSYEIFNFQRWFILREFLLSNNLTRCLYLDSDVMLYGNVTEESKRFLQFDFTLLYGMCPATFFLNNVAALTQFCEFLLNVYAKAEGYYYDKLVSHFLIRQKNGLPGGACDMNVFEFYRQERFGEVGELAEILDGSTFDGSINCTAPGFEMKDGVKAITWKSDIPYGKATRTGTDVRFNSLHFQGGAKRLLSQYYVGNVKSSSHGQRLSPE
jgi:hypothetical protein